MANISTISLYKGLTSAVLVTTPIAKTMNNTTVAAVTVSTGIDWTPYLKSFTMYIVFGYPSMLFNSFIVAVIAKDKQLRDKHFLIMCLAIGDFCIGFAVASAVAVRFHYVIVGTINSLVSRLSCLFRPWNIGYILGYQITSLISLIISIERFACVAFPIQYYNIPHKLYIRIGAAMCFVFSFVSLVICAITVWDAQGLVHNTCLVTDGMTEGYAIFNYSLCSSLGVLTAVIYISSIVVMRINMKRLADNPVAARRLGRQAKISKMMSVVLSAQFVFVALPDFGFLLAIVLQLDYTIEMAMMPWFAAMATFNSCLNLMFYWVFNLDLRSAFKSALRIAQKRTAVEPITNCGSRTHGNPLTKSHGNTENRHNTQTGVTGLGSSTRF